VEKFTVETTAEIKPTFIGVYSSEPDDSGVLVHEIKVKIDDSSREYISSKQMGESIICSSDTNPRRDYYLISLTDDTAVLKTKIC